MLTANGKAICKLNGSKDRCEGINYMTLLNTSNASANVGSLTAFDKLMSSFRIMVGTGSAAPTSHDYNLTNGDAGLTALNKTNTHSAGDYSQDYIAIYTGTYRNDTENDITVSEVGIMGQDVDGAGQPWFLIARDTFESVTIAPGESYTFSMYIG